MGEHLPECLWRLDDNSLRHSECICPALRTVEDRAFHEGYKAGMKVEKSNTIKYGRRRYREALLFAIEAISPDDEFCGCVTCEVKREDVEFLTSLIQNPRSI